MPLLLDTQLALWRQTNVPRLTMKAREFILDSNSDIYISVASLREISINHQLVLLCQIMLKLVMPAGKQVSSAMDGKLKSFQGA